MPDQDEPPDATERAERGEPEQIVLMQRMVDLSVQRTDLAIERTEQSAQRSEMSAERSYMNAERTLSVWVRTALAVMVVGIAVDRFGLLLRQNQNARPDTASHWVGVALVAFGVVMVVLTAVRFRRYAVAYRSTHELPYHHGPFLAPLFALATGVFGVVILILLLIAP